MIDRQFKNASMTHTYDVVVVTREGTRETWLGLERDRGFKANKPLSEYTKEANANQRIVA